MNIIDATGPTSSEGKTRDELIRCLINRGVTKVRGDGGGTVSACDTDTLREAVDFARDCWGPNVGLIVGWKD